MYRNAGRYFNQEQWRNAPSGNSGFWGFWIMKMWNITFSLLTHTVCPFLFYYLNIFYFQVVKIISILRPHNLQDFPEIYVEFELMETDLASIIRSAQPLRDQHVQVFEYAFVNWILDLIYISIVFYLSNFERIEIHSFCKYCSSRPQAA